MRPIVPLIAACALVAPAACVAAPYAFIDLGAAPINMTNAHAVNASGQVAGVVTARTPGRPGQSSAVAIWDKTTGVKQVAPLPPGMTAEVDGLDDAGDISGWCAPSGGTEMGFFIPHGKDVQMVTAPGGGMTYLFGLNNKAQAVGYGNLDDGLPSQAFRWRDGSFTGCGRLGDMDSTADGIGPNGEIVGKSRVSGNDAEEHPFLYDDHHGMRDLGLLPGTFTGEACAVNAAGTVVGSCQSRELGEVPFIWTAAGGMKPLSANPKGTGRPAAINSSGVVVGTDHGKAVIWVNGVETDLAQYLPRGSNFKLRSAHAINDAGVIVGDGGINPEMTGSWHGWVLAPAGP